METKDKSKEKWINIQTGEEYSSEEDVEATYG